MDRTGGLTRGTSTWVLYTVLSCLGFLLNGMGAVLAPLQKDLGVDRAQVAFYPTLFAAGLLLIGLVGAPLVSRVGRAVTLRASIAGMIGGGLLLATPTRFLTLVGALLLGIGGALLIQLIPALLGALHPHAPAAAVGEANGLASAASVLAPLAVAGALAAGLGWRAGYLVAPLVLLAVVALLAWHVPMPDASEPHDDTPTGSRAALIGPWIEVVLAVSVEFCMVFWAASAVGDWHHASAGLAPAIASLFLVGMAAGRSFAVPVTRRVPGHRTLLLICIAVAAGGFALFWAAPTLPLAGVGLAVAGLGVALLYPTTVSRTVAAWPHAPDKAAARAAMASGVAIGGAPFLLARLSDTVSLRTAYLIVPALLIALAVRSVTARA
ncbi:MFS transporter [Actinoallomurus purpureus]|uniref:MFS transporter n=1 Tax=Actinoallomurus purpureus TaxID=478114 RepID=UPI002092D2CF|nr:MFS transporter [Actinoallomurus purpureus]MCO6007454.1 MFS transporter [Actinoallomurus purpureus]